MKMKGIRKSNNLYASFFLSLTICIVVTIVSLSSILYISFEGIALSNIYSSEKNSLSQAGYSATSMIEASTNHALQIYADPQFDKLLHYSTLSSMDINSGINRLNTYSSLNNFFHSIYIYSRGSNSFYITSPSFADTVQSKELFLDGEARELIDNFGDYQRLAPIPRKIPLQIPVQSETKTANVYTFMYYDLPGSSKQLDNAIMLNVSERWMKDTISSLDVSKDGSTFIIDRDGQLITSTNTTPFLTPLSGKAYIQQLLSASAAEPSGYFVEDVDGVKSLVVYSKQELSSWIFIRVLPYDGIMGKIEAMKTNVLVVCAVILFLGLGVSLLLSRRLYKPIEKLMFNLNHLLDEKRNYQYKLKQDFLRRLILNREGEEDKLTDVEAKLKEHGIPFAPVGDYGVIILSIDHFSSFADKYNFKDRQLMKYAMMNIGLELLAPLAPCEAVDMDERNVAIIVNCDLAAIDGLTEAVKNIQQAAQAYLSLSLSASVSETGDSLAELPGLYQQALLTLENKFFCGFQCVLYGDFEQKPVSAPYIYPAPIENYLLETLKLGKAEETKKWFLELLGTLQNHAYPVYNMFFNQHAYALWTTAMSIEKTSGFPIPYDFSNFIQRLNSMETLEEIRRHFFSLFDAICSEVKTRKVSKHENLTATIDKIIQENYGDPDLSLYKMADLLDMSPAYLGRLFKKFSEQSIPDYLNEYRIERAKESLANTADSIDTISRNCGYNNSTYFYKVFKKYTGITPSEYRNNSV